MLYTKNGDDGKTNLFGCDQKISKSSAIAEALGCLDEINSYLGVIKSKASEDNIVDEKLHDIIHRTQNDLFIVQAQIAGAEKNIKKDEIEYIENLISKIENKLPKIKSFFISGANEISADLDFARTLARRAERRVVAVSDEGLVKINSETLIFMNRISSLLYALARYQALKDGVEASPEY